MIIRTTDTAAPRASEITPRAVWQQRRQLMVAGAAALLGGSGSLFAGAASAAAKLTTVPGPTAFGTTEKPTPLKDISSYNNYYEFGTDKGDPVQTAGSLKTSPWTVEVSGLVNKPHNFDIDELRKLAPLEDRVYRLRCVEGWSMVIPWVGFPLAELLKRVEPTGSAKFVEFTTLADNKQMPGLRSPVLAWPYLEGLRMDEAMHPLTLLSFGLYGEVLPNQNGAPVRLVVPWKYGFKSAKSLVKIRLVDKQPISSWNLSAPQEYGFYSNVNPDVDHPRWSQATERRIGEDGFLARKRKTLPFNGYGEQVASLYTGMDLRRNF